MQSNQWNWPLSGVTVSCNRQQVMMHRKLAWQLLQWWISSDHDGHEIGGCCLQPPLLGRYLGPINNACPAQAVVYPFYHNCDLRYIPAWLACLTNSCLRTAEIWTDIFVSGWQNSKKQREDLNAKIRSNIISHHLIFYTTSPWPNPYPLMPCQRPLH